MIRMLKGSQLRKEDQIYVLAAYVHRFTGDHKPQWANGVWLNDKPYPVQFVNDQDWLEHTLFSVRKDGHLDRRTNHCESHPTWPNGR